jgi:cytidine deaminase
VWPEINIRTQDRQDCTTELLDMMVRHSTKISTAEDGQRVTIAHHTIFSEIGLGMKTKKVSSATRERLLGAARKVMKNAYAPFSNFRVGAAILTSKGQVFVGCNVENSSFGMTNCAERTAIFSAIAKDGPDLEIVAVAVANDQGIPCSPCGACRQVIHEFGPRAVIFYDGQKGPKQSPITDLLPEGFRLK